MLRSRRAKLTVLWLVTGGLLVLPLLSPAIASAINRPLQVLTLIALTLLLCTLIRDRRVSRKAEAVLRAGRTGAYVMLDGRRFPVDSVRLTEGGILVQFSVRGPMPEMSGDLTVFGEDGRGCWQCPDRHVNATEAGHVRRVGHLMHMTQVFARPPAGPISLT